MARLLTSLCGILLVPSLASAQHEPGPRTCFPPEDSHEARVFAAVAVPLAFSMLETPGVGTSGWTQLVLEITYLPPVDEEIRTPTICEPGKGPENTDLLFAFPRPRITLGLPAGFVLEASWLPPIRLKDVKSSLVGFSLARVFALRRGQARLALRGHGLVGLILAPITCDENALRDEASECFDGTRSNDKYRPNIFGLEAAISWSLAGGRAHPFLGGGFNVSQPRFQVNFTDRLGSTDSTKVRVKMPTRGCSRGLPCSGDGDGEGPECPRIAPSWLVPVKVRLTIIERDGFRRPSRRFGFTSGVPHLRPSLRVRAGI